MQSFSKLLVEMVSRNTKLSHRPKRPHWSERTKSLGSYTHTPVGDLDTDIIRDPEVVFPRESLLVEVIQEFKNRLAKACNSHRHRVREII